MRVLRRLVNVARSLAGRGPVDRDLDLDVTSYLEMLVDEKVARGMAVDEARREARLEIGGVEQVKEAVRAGRPAAWLETVARDVRYSIRLMRKSPAFSLTAILVIALGIGATTTVFSLVNVLLFQPLPGSERPGQVVGVYRHDRATSDSYRSFTYADYEEIRGHRVLFDDAMAFRTMRAGLTDGETSRRARVEAVSGNYFSTLGVHLARGRSFTREEERPGQRAAVAVISHRCWLRLGGRDDIVGQSVLLNSRPFTVVGIAPARFTGTTMLTGPEVWIPLGSAELLSTGSGAVTERSLRVVGRLKPGTTLAAANGALGALSATIARMHPEDRANRVLTVSALARTESSDQPRDDSALFAPLGTLMGVAVVVLVIACLNVANMQLARGMARRKEIAMRLALGAGRARVVAQLLTEGFLLSLAGGAAGLVFSVWILRVLVASLTPLVDRAIDIDVTPDATVLMATLVFCALSAAVFALAPAWTLSRVDLLPEIKGSGDRDRRPAGVRAAGPRNLLVAGQVALSLALLAAAGLFVRSAVAARQTDPGYGLDRQLVARVDTTIAGYDELQGRQAFQRIMERIRATAGVESASMASFIAFGNESATCRVRTAGGTRDLGPDASNGDAVVLEYAIGARYFKTLGLSLLRGREFTIAEEQAPASRDAVIIDEPLAMSLFPGQDPLGRHIEVQPTHSNPKPAPLEIVGVAPGLRQRLTDTGPVPHIYRPLGSNYNAALIIHVRPAAAGPAQIARLLRTLHGEIRAADSHVALLTLSTLSDARDASPTIWLVRTAGQAFGALGLIALAMAVIGLYGVKAFHVARRTHEIGIRMALGAKPGDVIAMILKEGGALIAVGVLVGIVLAVGAGRIVRSLLKPDEFCRLESCPRTTGHCPALEWKQAIWKDGIANHESHAGPVVNSSNHRRPSAVR